jgi:hypothetical protein
MVSREALAAAVDGVNRSGGVSSYKPYGPPVVTSLRPGPPSPVVERPGGVVVVNVSIGTVIVIGPSSAK